MVWRGGARFDRCLESIAAATPFFRRVIISLTAPEDSEDMRLAQQFQRQHPSVEVICTGSEFPTMQHQTFWVDYLQRSGASPDDWIYWLAYDDQVRSAGISALIDDEGNWPLNPKTAYIGPWAMRHESAEILWTGIEGDEMQSWTSFPHEGPTRMPLLAWIREQLRQPTYMQMSGSVMPFGNYLELRDGTPRKKGPMRIEMATAAGTGTEFVEEFSQPISVIYGRSNSDRASYGNAARAEDIHLLTWLARWVSHHPRRARDFVGIMTDQLQTRVVRSQPPTEEWRVRGTVR